jgi:hypothetical protein
VHARGQVQAVAVHHQHVRIAGDAQLGQRQQGDAGMPPREIAHPLAHARPARVRVHVVAHEDQRGRAVAGVQLRDAGRLQRHHGAHQIGPGGGRADAEYARLRMADDDHAADPLQQGQIAAQDGGVGMHPARHHLRGQLAEGLHRELRVAIGAAGAGARARAADAKARVAVFLRLHDGPFRPDLGDRRVA